MKKILLLLFILCINENLNADSWSDSGNYTISWYSKTKSEFYISTAQELAGVAYLVNNGYTKFQNQSIKLSNDINLSGKIWNVIGNDANNYFAGSFDGMNHTINGLNITEESGKHHFGLFGYAVGGSIRNLQLYGKINVEKEKNGGTVGCVGGLVGYCKGGNIAYCKCYVDVYGCQESTFTTSYKIYLGGIIGHAYDNVKISYCLHNGYVNFQFGSTSGDLEWYSDSNYTYVGGLIGYTYNCDVRYCENSSSIIKTYAYGSRNSSSYSMDIGGCIGYSSEGRIESCTSKGELYGFFKGSKIMNISLGGICGGASGKIVNCYTPETRYSASSSGTNAILYYGGITASSSSSMFTNNYSPSNINLVSDLTKVSKYFGSTSFSSNEMKTNNFLEELNFYPFLEYGKNVWSRDNDYPYITDLYISTDINTVLQNDHRKNGKIYSLSGQRINKPQKGVVIIDGKKFLVK